MEKVIIKKLKVNDYKKLDYHLLDIPIYKSISKNLKIEFTGNIFCLNCEKKTKKSFSQGYCYPCFKKLACCDMCILKPELCHYKKGTCREPEWGERNCLISHAVYLANSSGLKVGVTREHQKMTRWIDQGAYSAVQIAKAPERLIAGQIEIYLKKFLNDKTNWRYLITGKKEEIDLIKEYKKIHKELFEFSEYLIPVKELELYNFNFNVIKYLEKAKTFNAEKERVINSRLNGIHGQYLILEDFAMNVRKYQGYEIKISL